MSLDSPIDADALWDAWCSAREREPELTADRFARDFEDLEVEVLELLEVLLSVEERAPLPSLVRVLRPGADGELRFAGFRLLEELGEGAAGIVFEAVDDREGSDGERVALKLLNPVLGSGRSARDQILREARVTALLKHPGIVRVHGSGVEQGYAWIATELIAGDSLEGLIDDGVPASQRVARALDVGVQIAGALEHAHARGVLHRDLKPSNVMIRADGSVVVLDFGLASGAGAAFGVSHTGEAVGTPLYMAPEQLRGERDLDGRADVYALGLVLLELATGRSLRVQESVLKTMARIARGEHRFPERLFAGLPRDLAGVLSRCLEPDRRDRYDDVSALLADLRALQRGEAPRLARLGRVERLRRGVIHRPVRSAAWLALLVALLAGVRWGLAHWPITMSLDSTVRRPTRLLVDGEEVSPALPATFTFFRRGTHKVELHLGDQRYPIDLEVADDGARTAFLPCGPLYPRPAPLPLAGGGLDGGPLSLLHVAVRAAEDAADVEEMDVRLEVDGRVTFGIGAFSQLPLPVRAEPYTLRVESEGYRPRELVVHATSGATQAVMLELDREESPWRTIVVGSPLDPALRTRVVREEKLNLRWIEGQQDAVTDSFVHQVGLGVARGAAEGLLEMEIPLPCEVGELQLLSFANPMIDGKEHPGSALLVEMGPNRDQLLPVLDWNDHPGQGPDPGGGPWEIWTLETQAELGRRIRSAGTRTLFVRYRLVGDAAWALRTNALPRRSSRGVQWDPALVLRVRPPESLADPAPAAVDPGASSLEEPRRQIDFSGETPLVAFAAGSSEALVPFDGELLRARLAVGGDVDGDGVGDVAVMHGLDPGRIELRSGADGSLLWWTESDAGDGFSADLVFVPDMNEDGAPELFVGTHHRAGDLVVEPAPGRIIAARERGPGYVQLLSGATGDVLGERRGEHQGEGFGSSLDYVGDLDGQGRHAVIVSTSEREAGGWGVARLLSLPELDVLWEGSGDQQFGFYGTMCAAAGDVNADGHPDLLVGAATESRPYWDSGAVYVYSGDEEAGFPLLRRVVGEQAWTRLGGMVRGLGDVDGDGHDDWATSRSWHMTDVISGRTGERLWTFPGGGDRVWFDDVTPRLTLDLDEDGTRDLAVPGYVVTDPDPQRRTLVAYSLRTGEPLLELRSKPGRLVAQLIPFRDVDGDGREDLLVGVGRRADGGGLSLAFLLAKDF